MRPNWRQIADRLAERLSNHAYCPSHSLAEADPANCPFCDDRAACQEYALATTRAAYAKAAARVKARRRELP